MLSFDTIHALTGRLITATSPVPGQPARVLLFLHPGSPHRVPAAPAIRSVSVPIPGGSAPCSLLDRFASILCDRPAPERRPRGSGEALAQHLLATRRAGRLFAVAVRCEDRPAAAGAGGGGTVRVDGVDTDGRVYRICRQPGDVCPSVYVDDMPDPAANTLSRGLRAVLDAAHHLPHCGGTA